MNQFGKLKTTRGATLGWMIVLAIAIAAGLAPAPNSQQSPIGAVAAFAECDTCGTAGHDPTGPGRP